MSVCVRVCVIILLTVSFFSQTIVQGLCPFLSIPFAEFMIFANWLFTFFANLKIIKLN